MYARITSLVFLFGCIILLFGCQPNTSEGNTKETNTDQTKTVTDPYGHIKDEAVRGLLEKAIERAGGLEAWQSLKSLLFQKYYALYDENRKIENSAQQSHTYYFQPKEIFQIQWKDQDTTYQIVKEGDQLARLINNQIDTTANPDALLKTIESATFVISIPFKLLDPGVELSYAGQDTLENGNAVEVLKAIYNPASTDAHSTPDTWWHYYDAEDYTFVGYMVQHADHYSYVINKTFDELDGFVFPRDRESYRVDADRNKLYLRAQYRYSGYSVGK